VAFPVSIRQQDSLNDAHATALPRQRQTGLPYLLVLLRRFSLCEQAMAALWATFTFLHTMIDDPRQPIAARLKIIDGRFPHYEIKFSASILAPKTPLTHFGKFSSFVCIEVN
jgi:hypothetical protein